jgi:TP901 family phage tail tape measure protein
VAGGKLIVGTLAGELFLEDRFSAPADAVNRLVDAMGSRFDAMGGKLTSFGATLTSIGGNVARFGDRLTLLTAPLTAAALASGKLANSFEKDMMKLVTLAGTSVNEMERLRGSVLRLAPEAGRGPDELAKGLYAITSVGMRGAQSMEILERSAKGASMGMGDTEDIARALVSALVAYGDQGLTAAKAMDSLHMAVTEGGAEAEGFANTLGRVIATAKLAGVSFDELVGSVATFTRLGVRADEAVTALRGTMSVLLKPSAEARQELIQLGTSIEELRNKVKKDGLADALIDLVKLTKGNDDAIAHIVPNVRALAGVLANADAQADAYRNIVHLSAIATGNFDRAVQQMSTTSAFKMQQFWAQIQVLAIEFGEHLLPVVIKFIAASQPLIRVAESLIVGFGGLPKPLQTTVLLLGGLGLAMGPLLSVGGRLIQLVGSMATGYQMLIRWLTGAAAAQRELTVANDLAAINFSNFGSTLRGIVMGGTAGVGVINQLLVSMKLLTAAEVVNGVVVFESSMTKLGAALLMLGRVSGIIALVAALGAALYKVGEAVRDAKNAFDQGKLWEHLTARDTDNWVRRWLGLGDGAKAGASGIEEGVAKTSAAMESLRTLQDKMQGLDLKNQVNELGLVYGRLNETAALTPDVLTRVSQAATELASRGAVLPQFLGDLVQKQEEVTLGADAAARGLHPFADALDLTRTKLEALSAATRQELITGAANFGLEEFLKKAALIPEAARIGQEALRNFYQEIKEGERTAAEAKLETTKLTEEYNVLVTSHSKTTYDAQIADVERWANNLIAKMQKAGADTKEFYNMIALVSKEKMREMSADWNWLRDNSLQAAYQKLHNAQQTMIEMMTNGLTYGRAQWDEIRQRIEDAADAVRNYGREGANALSKGIELSIEAGKKFDWVKTKLDAEAEAAKKVADEFQRMRDLGNELEFDLSTQEGMDRFKKLNPNATVTADKSYFLTHTIADAIREGFIVLSGRLPHFATGVRNFPGGAAVVGEKGPELVTLPRGSSVFPNNTPMTSRWGQVLISMYVNGLLDPRTMKEVSEVVSREVYRTTFGSTQARANG